MKKKSVIYLAVLLNLLIVGCGSTIENSEPSDTDIYFPMKIGNYWIYEYYEYNINGEQVGGIQVDSILVKEKINKLGKNSYKLELYRNNVLLDSNYYYTDEKNIYRYYEFNYDTLPVGMKNSSWLRITKFDSYKSESWHLYDSTFKDASYTWKDIIYKGYKKININAEYVNWNYRVAFGKSLYDFEYNVYYDQINEYLDSLNSINFTHKITEKIHYVENIGIYEWFVPPTAFSILENQSNLFPIYTNGWHRKLLRYSLK